MMNSNTNQEDPSISQETAESGGVTSEGPDSGIDDGLNRRPVGRRKDGRNYVQKNSLTEAELLAAREQTRTNLKRKAKTELTEDDKKEDRRAANRLSAFQSRQRRKMIIEDLQKTVAEQSKHNADQAKEIAELKRQLQAARQENELMRHQMTGGAGTSGFGSSQLFGGAGHIPGGNPLLQLGQSQMNFQQNQLLQNAMLQNALLFSAQAQQQARGNQQNGNAMQQANNMQPMANGTGPKADLVPNVQMPQNNNDPQQEQQQTPQVSLPNVVTNSDSDNQTTNDEPQMEKTALTTV
mmetsp:Transcript_6207/g.12757  ORF Transcript_6207/g.12757 Transcript_6207/m.12757 type:complete len:295 (+) Transcript_6207:36-920(+)